VEGKPFRIRTPFSFCLINEAAPADSQWFAHGACSTPTPPAGAVQTVVLAESYIRSAQAMRRPSEPRTSRCRRTALAINDVRIMPTRPQAHEKAL